VPRRLPQREASTVRKLSDLNGPRQPYVSLPDYSHCNTRGPSDLTVHVQASGGRTWWAHFEFTRINIEPIIIRKKIEELMNVRGVGEKNFLKLKTQIVVSAAKADHEPQ